MNGIDDITRYWNGGGYSQDNESEDFATYHYEFVFYTKGLNDGDIRKAFNNEKITVSWTNNKNEQVEKEYNISNLIEFSSNN